MRAGAQPSHAFVDGGRSVRHRAEHGNPIGDVPLDLRSRNRCGDRQHRLLRREQVADLAEQRVEVLGLDRDHDERCAATASVLASVVSTP